MTPEPAHTVTITDLNAACARVERGRRFQRDLLMQQPPAADLTRALLDAVALFEALRIDYALVGGIAAMCYGRTRFTEDVDFIASPGHLAALTAHPQVMRQHHFDPACTWKLYHESSIEIDLWKDEYVADMIRRATIATLGGRAVKIVDVHDLIAMKLRAGRQRDDYDVSEICKHAAVDGERLRTLISIEQFDRFSAIRQRSERER